MDTPLLTPGLTGGDEDRDLDQTFRSDKIEFMIVHRQLDPDEVCEGSVLKDPADVDWAIPSLSEYEDIMGLCMDIYTDDHPELVHTLS